VDVEWLHDYLIDARALAGALRYVSRQWVPATNRTELRKRAPYLAQCIDTLFPGGGSKFSSDIMTDGWLSVRTRLDQALYVLDEGPEIQRRLGPPAGPALRADVLHPTVWDAAKSLWRSNHRRQAVEAAAVAVNAALQEKLGRRDVSNTDLVRQAFTRDRPAVGRPRLRLGPDDGSETYRSLHDGAREFGGGCFMALRNLVAHDPVEEIPEQIALEQLAAFSILARWIEDASVLRAES